jgi:hypothetical protein
MILYQQPDHRVANLEPRRSTVDMPSRHPQATGWGCQL